jgi:hypothetical protein
MPSRGSWWEKCEVAIRLGSAYFVLLRPAGAGMARHLAGRRTGLCGVHASQMWSALQ